MTYQETSWLGRNLKFVPTPLVLKATKTEFNQSIDNFFTRLRATVLFEPDDDRNPIVLESRFRLPSKSLEFMVASKYSSDPWLSIEKYIQQTRSLFYKALQQHVPQGLRNISRSGLLFIKSLAANPAVIVKPADKGLGLTVLNRDWYDRELDRQLNDRETYIHVPVLRAKLSAPIKQIAKTALQLGMMTQQQHTYVCKKWNDETSQLPNLYLLPKLHKTPVTGRPIVSSHSYITTPASVWLDYFLQPLVREHIPTVLTDSKQLVNRIESTIINDPNCTLSTADVNSLYPSIPIKAGIAAVRMFLQLHCKITDQNRVNTICSLLKLILENNYFKANRKLYKQIKGTAMGTPCAVVFANIYMFMTFDKPLRIQLGEHVRLYGRFIDDIIIITSHLAENTLHHTMNAANPVVTLAIKSSPRRCEFLDLVIYKGTRFDQNGILDLSVHQKDFNLYLYIPWNSFHLRSMKVSFIQTELRRYIRNSSSYSEFERIRASFFHRLRDRGYPAAFLINTFKTISYYDRARFLGKSAPSKHGGRPVIFKTTYTPLTASIRIKQIITKYWDLLDPEWFPNRPIVGYKRTANIGSLLCKAKS